MDRVDFDNLEGVLGRSEANLGAAESHGLLCGLLCCRASLAQNEWAGFIFDEPVAGDVLQRESLDLLHQLLDDSRNQLADEDLSFRLLLPDDDIDLGERTRAMAAWTEGFVFGLGAGGLNREWQLSSDSAELLADFQQLARAEFDELEVDEQDESDYAEVVEFLRVGVLVINRELLPLRDPMGAAAARAGSDLVDADERRTLH